MKPRLAENAADLWKAINRVTDSGKVGPGGRILYPVVRVFECGDFRVSTGRIEKLGWINGVQTVSPATNAEIEELSKDIELDRAQVLLMSHWGGSGNDRMSKPVEVLHSPSGLAFGKL